MKKLRVRYSYAPPFCTHKLGTDSGFGGIMEDMLEGMKIFINNFDYAATLQPDKAFGETDITGPFKMNEERSKVVQFSEPFVDLYLGIMSGVVETQKNPLIIFQIFTVQIWVAILSSILFMASAATAVYFVLPTYETRSLPTVFFKYLWSFQICLLNKNFGCSYRWFMRHACDSTSFRMLLLTWFLPCLVLAYSYQGGILSAFASNKLQPKIASLDDLLNDESIEIIAWANTATEKSYGNLQNTRYGPIWERMKGSLVNRASPGTFPPWMERVHKGQAIVTAFSYDLKRLVGDWYKKRDECGLADLAVSNIGLGNSYVALALRKEFINTNFLKQFNRGIRLFNEGGLAHFSLLRANRNYEKYTLGNTSVTKPLNLTDLMGAFVVLGTGLAAASVLFVIEMLYSRISKMKKQTC
ncbi:hypothetical protein JTE90_006645 [Oedothorax gibbosus]|uniref:Ionotropic glutamate receptor C-terminal domain-containing protein n=1 Tax=Oedothorax gibbosus TaxID=931172 RepID=A0AAV6TTR4_9ARAC|nr:hypothetical protein JTE90_006645 [Oedothorax gibbosus]